MEIEESVRGRELGGFVGGLGRLLLIAIPLTGMFFLLNVPQYLGWLVFNEQYMGLFLGLGLCATFILIPVKPSVGRNAVPWYDIAAALAGFAVGFYIFIFYPSIVNSLGDIATERVILGCVTILLLAEASRRLVGWPLVIIASCFLLYALFRLCLSRRFLWQGLVDQSAGDLSISRCQWDFRPGTAGGRQYRALFSSSSAKCFTSSAAPSS